MNFKLTTDKRLAVAIALLLLSAIIVVTVSIFQTRQVNTSAKMVAHTQEVLLQSERLITLVLDNESAARGYVLTARPTYKNSAELSKTEIYKALSKLKTLTVDNAIQQKRLDSLQLAIDKRLNFSEKTIVLRDQKTMPEAMAMIDTGTGRFYTDSIKSFISDVQGMENDLLEIRRKINEEANSDLKEILLLVIIFILILLAFFIQKIRFDLAQRKATAKALTEVNSKLEQKVEERTNELVESKTNLEQTFLRITDAFLALDKNWNYTYVNKQLGELVHRKPEDLIGKNVWEEFPAAIDSATYNLFFKAMEEQHYMWNEDYFEALDLWQENHVYPSLDGISVYIRDITERKKREKELQEINSRYLYVTRATSDAIWDWDLTKNSLYWGQGFKNIFGYNIIELQPNIETWTQHLHPDDLLRIKASLDKIISGTNINWNEDYRFIKADGSYAYITDRGFVLRNENGKALRLIGAMQDVTESKMNTARLEESEKRFSDLFQLSPQPKWLFDPQTLRFVQVNKAAIETYGYSEDEFLNMTIMDIRPEGQYQKLEVTLNSILLKDVVYTGLFQHRKKSGEIIDVELYGGPITIEDKIYRTVLAIDVTEKIRFENKITRAIIKTQEDERYEIGGELHDNVCQLLATSQLTLGMMKEHLSPKAKDLFDQSRSYITQALEEIRNISHKLAPSSFSDASFERSIEILLQSLNVENKYIINFTFDENIKNYAIGNEVRLNLYRILQEQLNNIQKYSKATQIKITIQISDGYLVMDVNDNGIGFDPHAVKNGIGLSNMKRRAELFSGKLEIRSETLKGCGVKVTIPL